jgi:NH3-dependent NAD+ synthetase
MDQIKRTNYAGKRNMVFGMSGLVDQAVTVKVDYDASAENLFKAVLKAEVAA